MWLLKYCCRWYYRHKWCSQLSLFSGGGGISFKVFEELLEKFFERFKIESKKLCGVTNVKLAVMSWKIKGFTNLFTVETRVKITDIMVNHSVIHQENPAQNF